MTSFTRSALFTFLVSCALTATYGTHYPDVIYAEDMCDDGYETQYDVRIKLSRNTSLAAQYTCFMIITQRLGSRLVATFLAYSMNKDYTNEQGNCTYESIQLYDSEDTPLLSTTDDYCSAKKPQPLGYQYELDGSGSIQFHTGLYGPVETADVDLLVTEVMVGGIIMNSTCPVGFFDCHTGYCVTNEVTCNGYDDCGNNRDEDNDCGISPGTIAGIIIGVIIFIIVCLLLIYLFRRYRRRNLYVQQF